MTTDPVGSQSLLDRLRVSAQGEQARFWGCCGLLYIGFWVFAAGVRLSARLPSQAYTEDIILAHFLQPKGYVVLGVGLILLLRSRNFRWAEIEDGKHLRVYCTVLALMLAYAFATHPYNYYLDQAHLFDRLILVGCALAVWRYPLLLIPTLYLSFVMHWQVGGPSPITSNFTDKLLPIHMASVAASYVLLIAFLPGRRFPFSSFLFVSMMVFASQYFWPGMLKTQIGPQMMSWVTDNEIGNLAIISTGQGFLPFGLSEETLVEIGKLAITIQPIVGAWVLLGQLAGILCFVSRRVFTFLAYDYMALHIGIFLMSGIFFWKWIIVDAAFLWLVLHTTKTKSFFISPLDSDWPATVLKGSVFFVCVYFSHTLFAPVGLAWFDTKTTYAYHIIGIGESGDAYEIPRSFFAPYDLYFAQSRFYFLESEEQKVLTGTFGGTNHGIAKRINATSSYDELKTLEAKLGRTWHDETKARGLANFLSQFLRTYNEKGRVLTIFEVIGRPSHIWSEPIYEPRYTGQVAIKTIRVVRKTLYFDGDRLLRPEEQVVLEVQVES